MPREPYPFRSPLKQIAVRLFDLAGYALTAGQRNRRPAAPAQESLRKILVIRLDQLGDILLTRPALTALRSLFPEATIDLAVTESAEPLFRDDPAVDRVHAVSRHWFEKDSPLRQQWRTFRRLLSIFQAESYDLAIDFRGDLRHVLLMKLSGIPLRAGFGVTGGGFLLTHCASSGKPLHPIRRNLEVLKLLGWQGDPLRHPVPFSAPLRKTFESEFAETLRGFQQPRILVHPGAGLESKRWPAPCFRQLLERLAGSGLSLILIGTQEEKNLSVIPDKTGGTILDLRGKTTLSDLALIMEQCFAFLGHDSGPAHLAAAQGVPVFCLFSPENDPELWHPDARELKMVIPPSTGRNKRGKLEDLTVDEVYNTFTDWLETLKGKNSHA